MRGNNGIQYSKSFSSQQLPLGIDPYIDKYKPELGFINELKELGTEEGEEDKAIQAYCFRMCLTIIYPIWLTIKMKMATV